MLKSLDSYVQKRIIKSKEDVNVLVDKALAKKCSNRCLLKPSDGFLRCHMPKYI